jgi:hypothetical protein
MERPKDYKVVKQFISRSAKKKDQELIRHTVIVEKNGRLTCSCKGFQYRRECWHFDNCVEYLADHYKRV